MTVPDRPTDQRRSFRCGVPEPHQEAELKIGWRCFPVSLFNESSGGFAAWMKGGPRVQVDDVLELRTTVGWFQVRVVYVSPVPASESQDDSCGAAVRVGLQRLHDLRAKPDDEAVGRRKGFMPVGRGRFSLVLMALALAIVLGVASVGTSIIHRHFNPSQEPGFLWDFAAFRSSRSADPPNESLRFVLRRLGLNNVQEKQIQTVAESMAKSFQDLDAQWKDDLPSVRAQKQAMLIDAARREVFRHLTSEQRERWKWLVEAVP